MDKLNSVLEKLAERLDIDLNVNIARCQFYCGVYPLIVLSFERLFRIRFDNKQSTVTKMCLDTKYGLITHPIALKKKGFTEFHTLIEELDEERVNLLVKYIYDTAAFNTGYIEYKKKKDLFDFNISIMKLSAISNYKILYSRELVPRICLIRVGELYDDFFANNIESSSEEEKFSKIIIRKKPDSKLVRSNRNVNDGYEPPDNERQENELLEVEMEEAVLSSHDEEDIEDEDLFSVNRINPNRNTISRTRRFIPLTQAIELSTISNKLNDKDKSFLKSLCLASVASSIHFDGTNDLQKISNANIIVDVNTILLASLLHSEAQTDLAEIINSKSSLIHYPSLIYSICNTLLDFSNRYNYSDTREDAFIHICYDQIERMEFTLLVSSFIQDYLNCQGKGLLSAKPKSFAYSLLDRLISAKPEGFPELVIVTNLVRCNSRTDNVLELLNTRSSIERSLNESVIGQKTAVSDLCDEWFSTSLDKVKGPRMINTFAGPSGVGKSFLARSLCDVLNRVEVSGYLFSEIPMAQYTGEKDVNRLFGSGHQYSSASNGVLTNLVKFYPRHIILFDELEKAHPNVIQSLLSILDTGIDKDATMDVDVDFSQAILIFTTNIGQHVIKGNTGGHQLDVLDLLSNTGSTSGPSDKHLSPEMVNRLSKGAAVVFNELSTPNLVKIAKKIITDTENMFDRIDINWGDHFEYNYLRLLSPGISSRRIGSELKKLSSKILTYMAPHIINSEQNVNIDLVFKGYEPVTKTRNFLVVTSNVEYIEFLLSDTHELNVTVANSISGINISNQSAVLVDSRILKPMEDDALLDISMIVDDIKNIPLFIFSINGLKKIGSLETHESVRRVFLPQSQNLGVAFQEMTSKADTILNHEESITNLIRLNQKVKYRFKRSENPNELQLIMDKPVHSVSSDDAGKTVFRRVVPTERLEDVIGLERAKLRISQVIEFLKKPELFTDQSVRPPTGYLITGSPGTGKTMLARAVAGECQLPFFTLSVAEIASNDNSGPISKIQDLFAMARKYAPSIIFIDEIDAIGKSREHNSNTILVNTLLTEMDGFSKSELPIFILAATNHPETLDPALLRAGRFDEVIHCDYPNYNARLKLFNFLFSEKSCVHLDEGDMESLASLSVCMSAADIDQAYRESIYDQRASNETITFDTVQDVIYRIRYGSPVESVVMSDRTKWETAYHEAGHLIVQKVLTPESRIDYITIEPRDNSLGFVATTTSDLTTSLTLNDIKCRISILLAGREAELIFSGSIEGVSTGASHDLSQSTRLAYHAIFECGLDEELTPISVSMAAKFIPGDFTEYDAKVNRLIENCRSNTKDILKNNTDLHEALSKHLYEKESLMQFEINEFLSPYTLVDVDCAK